MPRVNGPEQMHRALLRTLGSKAYRWPGVNNPVLPNGLLVPHGPRCAAIASRLAMALRIEGRVASAWSISQVALLQWQARLPGVADRVGVGDGPGSTRRWTTPGG